MKQTPLILTVIAIMLAVGGFFIYKFYHKPELTSWDLIVDDAIAVYESDDCKQCLETIGSTTAWEAISKALFYNYPDTLAIRVKTLLSKKPGWLASIHAIKKDGFDFVIYHRSISSSDVNSQFPVKFNTREFEGVDIHEAEIGGARFAWTKIENIFVGSHTPFLVEDAVRAYKGKKSKFIGGFQSASNLPKIKGDGGDVYFQLKKLSEFAGLFSVSHSALLQSFGHSAVLDIKSDEQSVVLNGFSTDTTSQLKYVLATFKNQEPVGFTLKQLIPNRSVLVKSLGLSDSKNFIDELKKYQRRSNSKLVDSLVWYSEKSNVDFEELTKTIENQIAVCRLEGSSIRETSQVLILKTDKVSDWQKSFEKVALKFSIDTIFFESYGDFEIRDIPVPYFPEKLFWPFVSGFEQSFYTIVDNKYLVIADDVDELKNYLNDLESEETWGKSVSYNKFLETTLLESNFSLYFNTTKVWPSLSNELYPSWKKFLKENKNILNNFRMGAVQFSHLNNTYYTNVSIDFNPSTDKVKNTPKGSRTSVSFPSNISQLFIVKSHVNKSDEILVQDSLNDLTLLSAEGDVLWKISVGDQIRGDVTQIDYFNNGKLQYFFATRDAIHVIDRLGNYVSDFPIFIPGVNVQHAEVIDYDRSKKYRFLLANEAGKVYMYDKQGVNLEGWTPKDVEGELFAGPKHHRIRGKDFIVALRKDGMVLLMTRRGETINNFPIRIDTRIESMYVLEKGTRAGEYNFVFISNDGHKIEFNTEGKIVSKETLLKSSVNSDFSLIREESGKGYIIGEQGARTFKLIDGSGKILAENEFVGPHRCTVKYYDFGSGRSYYLISDLDQGLTYIYNGNGSLLSSPPIESSKVVLRPSERDEIKLFIVKESSLVIESL